MGPRSFKGGSLCGRQGYAREQRGVIGAVLTE
eukprot:COSAG01_NODE_71552_length_255_cov_1.294872_1_plen_31_part_10